MKKEFKVGDRVRSLVKNGTLFSRGAEGVVLFQDSEDDGYTNTLVAFDKGQYLDIQQAWMATGPGQWWASSKDLELVEQAKEKEMKSEGHGISVTKAWAVEVEGKIYSGDTFEHRSDARRCRQEYALMGFDASVRRVEIKVLKHKV